MARLTALRPAVLLILVACSWAVPVRHRRNVEDLPQPHDALPLYDDAVNHQDGDNPLYDISDNPQIGDDGSQLTGQQDAQPLIPDPAQQQPDGSDNVQPGSVDGSDNVQPGSIDGSDNVQPGSVDGSDNVQPGSVDAAAIDPVDTNTVPAGSDVTESGSPQSHADQVNRDQSLSHTDQDSSDGQGSHAVDIAQGNVDTSETGVELHTAPRDDDGDDGDTDLNPRRPDGVSHQRSSGEFETGSNNETLHSHNLLDAALDGIDHPESGPSHVNRTSSDHHSDEHGTPLLDGTEGSGNTVHEEPKEESHTSSGEPSHENIDTDGNHHDSENMNTSQQVSTVGTGHVGEHSGDNEETDTDVDHPIDKGTHLHGNHGNVDPEPIIPKHSNPAPGVPRTTTEFVPVIEPMETTPRLVILPTPAQVEHNEESSSEHEMPESSLIPNQIGANNTGGAANDTNIANSSSAIFSSGELIKYECGESETESAVAEPNEIEGHIVEHSVYQTSYNTDTELINENLHSIYIIKYGGKTYHCKLRPSSMIHETTILPTISSAVIGRTASPQPASSAYHIPNTSTPPTRSPSQTIRTSSNTLIHSELSVTSSLQSSYSSFDLSPDYSTALLSEPYWEDYSTAPMYMSENYLDSSIQPSTETTITSTPRTVLVTPIHSSSRTDSAISSNVVSLRISESGIMPHLETSSTTESTPSFMSYSSSLKPTKSSLIHGNTDLFSVSAFTTSSIHVNNNAIESSVGVTIRESTTDTTTTSIPTAIYSKMSSDGTAMFSHASSSNRYSLTSRLEPPFIPLMSSYSSVVYTDYTSSFRQISSMSAAMSPSIPTSISPTSVITNTDTITIKEGSITERTTTAIPYEVSTSYISTESVAAEISASYITTTSVAGSMPSTVEPMISEAHTTTTPAATRGTTSSNVVYTTVLLTVTPTSEVNGTSPAVGTSSSPSVDTGNNTNTTTLAPFVTPPRTSKKETVNGSLSTTTRTTKKTGTPKGSEKPENSTRRSTTVSQRSTIRTWATRTGATGGAASGTSTNTRESTWMTSRQTPRVTQVPTMTTSPPLYLQVQIRMSWFQFCNASQHFIAYMREGIRMEKQVSIDIERIRISNMQTQSCMEDGHNLSNEVDQISVDVYIVDEQGKIDFSLTMDAYTVMNKGFREDTSPFKNRILNINIHDARPIVRTTDKTPVKEEPGITLVIVIASVGACCCVVMIILQVMLRRRILAKKSRVYLGPRSSLQSMDHVALGVIPKSRPESGYWNPGLEEEKPVQSKHSHLLNFAGLANFCMDNTTLYEEFQTIPSDNPDPSCVPIGEDDKNRFANVLPHKNTRVKLRTRVGDMSDYINANYVMGYKDAKRTYIATQSPLVNTVEDFWRMIWEQQSRVILMLNSQLPTGKPRQSTCYWPDDEISDNMRQYGDYIVHLKKKDIQPDYVDCTLEIMDIERNLKREVHHFWLTCWPDAQTPEPLSIVKFILDTRPLYENSGAPAVVHCGPGTGRTGSLIAVDSCMRMFEDKRRVDIPYCVFKMRKQRAGAVHSKEQYSLIYQALNEYAVILGSPSMSSRSSVRTLHAML